MTELEKIIEQIKNGQTQDCIKLELNFKKIGDDGSKALSKTLKGASLPHLRMISLGSNQIGDDGAKALSKALMEANLPNLKEINLYANKIGDDGAIALSKALIEANLPNLEVINFYRNIIGDDGAKAFAKALIEANLPRLKEFILCVNQIGDKGAIAFAEALKEANLPHLKYIDLYRNKIGDVGAKAIAEALKEANLPHLESINLEHNQIGDVGAIALAKALLEANLPHLEFIDLEHNQIGDDGAEALNAASETCISSNEKHLAEATERAKQKLQQDWYSTPTSIELVLIDIEYAKLLQKEGKLKVAIDLYGAALHGFRHLAKAAPKFLNVKQIVKQTTEGMKIAIKEHKAKVGKLKLPIFVLLECFEHLNAKAFERDLLKLFADLGIKNIWEPKLVDIIFSMVPSKDVPDFSFDLFRKLTTASSEDDSKDESDAYNITGDVGTASQAEG